jgi:hypothetical protein
MVVWEAPPKVFASDDSDDDDPEYAIEDYSFDYGDDYDSSEWADSDGDGWSPPTPSRTSQIPAVTRPSGLEALFGNAPWGVPGNTLPQLPPATNVPTGEEQVSEPLPPVEDGSE